jgi:NitT/TauT family transport system ATP-binding protein
MRPPSSSLDRPIRDASPAATRPAIVASGLEKVYGSGKKLVPALGPMNLTIQDGEFLSIVGPSGCGKSTLLRVLDGLVAPTGGTVSMFGHGAAVPSTAMVFQDYSIFPWKTVEQNVRFGLDIAGVPRREATARVERWLAKLNLSEFRARYPAALSGGMKQRVSIARALVMEPEILLMDEPFAALDAQLRHVLQDELLSLWQDIGGTVVFITHNLDEAILLGDRVAVMSARPGTVVAEFEVPFDRPRTGDVRNTPAFSELEAQLWQTLRQELATPLETDS